MRLHSSCLWLSLSAAFVAVPAFPSSPITVVSVPRGALGAPGITPDQFAMVTWTSTVAFSNVTISAFVFSFDANHTAATAWLTTQTGAGSTPATLVAETSITLPAGQAGKTPELQIFSGLTLPPGQYYLIVSTTDDYGKEGWLNGDLPSPPVTAPGVTLNGPGHTTAGATVDSVYPPASNFAQPYTVGFAFDVTGLPLAESDVTGMVIPQVVDGAGWQSTVVVSNTSSIPAHAALQFFQTTDQAGDTQPWTLPTVENIDPADISLAPGASAIFHTPNRTSALSEGFGELVASPGVQAYVIFTLYVPGRQNQDGTAPAALPASDILIPFDNSPGFTSSIAVVNTSDAPETLTAKIALASGDTITSSLPSVPAHGHVAFALASQFPELAGQQGTLELSTTSLVIDAATGAKRPRIVAPPTFSVIGLRFNPTGAFTSLPVYSAYTAPF